MSREDLAKQLRELAAVVACYEVPDLLVVQIARTVAPFYRRVETITRSHAEEKLRRLRYEPRKFDVETKAA